MWLSFIHAINEWKRVGEHDLSEKNTQKGMWIKYADIDLLGLFREEHLNTLT